MIENLHTSQLLCLLSLQVHNLVAIELAYINTKHPDFTDAAQVSASVNSQQVFVSQTGASAQTQRHIMFPHSRRLLKCAGHFRAQSNTVKNPSLVGFLAIRQKPLMEGSAGRTRRLQKRNQPRQAMAAPAEARPLTFWTQ